MTEVEWLRLWKLVNSLFVLAVILMSFELKILAKSETNDKNIVSYVISSEVKTDLFLIQLKNINENNNFDFIENERFMLLSNDNNVKLFFFEPLSISPENPFVVSVDSSNQSPTFEIIDAVTVNGDKLENSYISIDSVNKSNNKVINTNNQKIVIYAFLITVVILMLCIFLYSVINKGNIKKYK